MKCFDDDKIYNVSFMHKILLLKFQHEVLEDFSCTSLDVYFIIHSLTKK